MNGSLSDELVVFFPLGGQTGVNLNPKCQPLELLLGHYHEVHDALIL